jgi:hypothetical protein
VCTLRKGKKINGHNQMNTEKAPVSQKGKISKGYRLKPSTHNLIKKIQLLFNYTQDKVISSALRMYYQQLKK